MSIYMNYDGCRVCTNIVISMHIYRCDLNLNKKISLFYFTLLYTLYLTDFFQMFLCSYAVVKFFTLIKY